MNTPTVKFPLTNFLLFSSARLSGEDPDDEELEEVEELERMTSLANQSLWTRLKKMVLDLVERVGFFGILVCASVSKTCSLWVILFPINTQLFLPFEQSSHTNYRQFFLLSWGNLHSVDTFSVSLWGCFNLQSTREPGFVPKWGTIYSFGLIIIGNGDLPLICYKILLRLGCCAVTRVRNTWVL